MPPLSDPADNTKPVTILIIDDDDVDVMSLKREFLNMRILNPIVRARDGLEGLGLLRQGGINKPYIVLLDLKMPRMSGLEMLKELREDDDLCHTVVFMLSTSHQDEDIIKAYKYNVAGYVVKQNKEEGILKMINMLESYWRIVELPTE